MELVSALKYLASAVAGGGLATLLTYRINLKKHNLTEFEMLLVKYKELHETLQEKVDELEQAQKTLIKEKEDLKDEVLNLRNQIVMFENSISDIPIPMWMKDASGRMLYMNKPCEDLILKPLGLTLADYIGKKDSDLWGEAHVASYAKTDKAVIRKKKPLESIEPIFDGHTTYYALVIKYPRVFREEVVGVSGIILRTADTVEELKR